MKTLPLFLAALFISFNALGQIKLNSSGNCGIGGNPSSTYKLKLNGPMRLYDSGQGNHYAPFEVISDFSPYGVHISGPTLSGIGLFVVGDSYTTGDWVGSDKRFKKNINGIDGKSMLTKLNKIQGKKYEFKERYELNNKSLNTANKALKFPKGVRYGLIAQELEKEFPELVKHDSITGTKAINYDGMIPVLLEAIKTLNAEVNTLKREISASSKKSAFAIDDIDSEDGIGALNLSNPELYQNVPNPFTQSTKIEMYIPEEAGKAILNIYNLEGYQLQSNVISTRGHVYLTLDGAAMTPGMYLYTLIIDGKEIETKRMILTE